MMKEYLQTRYDYDKKKRVPQATWDADKGKPATMIRKTAVGQGHHDAYPIEFQGMYTDAELPTGGAELSETPITVEGAVVEPKSKPETPKEPEKEPVTGDEPQDAEGVREMKCVTCETKLTVEDIMYLDAEGIPEDKCAKCLGVTTKEEPEGEPKVSEKKVKQLYALAAQLAGLTNKEHAKEIGIAAKAKVTGHPNVPATELTESQAEKLEIILQEHVDNAKEKQTA